jgi:hypothetical protein
MTTRRWLILVAILATEGGLIVNTLRNSGVDPLHARWAPILFRLAILHVVAFMPVGVLVLFRSSSGPRSLVRNLAMRLLRMTTRQWMIAVAVVAFISVGVSLPHRWYLHQQAEAHAMQVEFAEEMARRCVSQADFLGASDPSTTRRLHRSAEVYTRRVAYHAQLRQKYERAAIYPWLSVEPDPPPPN